MKWICGNHLIGLDVEMVWVIYETSLNLFARLVMVSVAVEKIGGLISITLVTLVGIQ